MDPSNGTELLKYTLPIEHVMGLTWDGSSFWAVSHNDSIIYQLNASDGSIMSSFPSPNPYTVETGCEGLAWDGQYLWYADSDLDMIFQLNSTDGTQVFSFPSPGYKPQGLAWDGMYLWHFDQATELIYKLSPLNGSILLTFPAPGYGEGDLAWDGEYLWMSRNSADMIYKIQVTGDPPIADAGEDQIVYEGDTVHFDGSASTDSDGTISTFFWDFDANIDSDVDGNTTNDIDATGPKPLHTYGDNGIYTVTLNVTDNNGYFDTDSCNITVNNLAPTINSFGPFTVLEGNSITLNATATDPGSDDLTFIWSWGDATLDDNSVYYNNGLGLDPYPSPNGNFPFTIIDELGHTYNKCGNYILNLTVADDDGGFTVQSTNVTVVIVSPPTLFINISQDANDVVLYWESQHIQTIDQYLIYRSTNQVAFDFNSVWVNTSIHKEAGESAPVPIRTMWNDTNAACPSNTTNYQEQYYYVIREVNIFGNISTTSRTVGKWTKSFSKGVSIYSLPLEPISPSYTDDYTTSMNASYIKYMDSNKHSWRQHNLGDGNTNNTRMKLGEGYEVRFEKQTNYTFCGMPAAMISYDDCSGFSGFDHLTEARSLNLFLDPDGDVILMWVEPGSMTDGWYEVYYSYTRDGFYKELNTDYFMVGSTLLYGINSTFHSGACANGPGMSLYYMVVPYNGNGIRGASTYSMGIWTEEYWEGYDTFGIPLKLNSNQCADWFCDNIEYTVGINFYNVTYQEWWWHSTAMPQNAFDPILKMTEGYQISTTNKTCYSYIGI